MIKRRPILKLIALLLVHSFLAEQLAFAAQELHPAKLDLFAHTKVDLGIPESIATIEDSYLAPAPGAKQLYLIQDAHTNTSGQFNLAKVLDLLLQKDKKIKYVFVEAGFGDDSLSFFRKQGTPEIRRRAAEPFLRSGELHGEEYLDLTSDHDFVVWGVEDLALYKKSVESYGDVARQREKFQSYLARVQSTVDMLKPRIYNASLLALDAKHEKFLKAEMPLTEYFDALAVQAQWNEINLARFPELASLKKLRQKETSIDFKKAGEEQLKAVQSLKPSDREAFSRLVEENHAPLKLSGEEKREDKAFYAFLEEKLTAPQFYPELFKYFEYLKLAKKVKAPLILKEIQQLEAELYSRSALTPDEKTLVRSQSAAHLLGKLFNLTLTPEEYQEYKTMTRSSPKSLIGDHVQGDDSRLKHSGMTEGANDFGITQLTGFLNQKIMELQTYYERAVFLEPGYEEIAQKAMDFYELTYSRDEQFVQKTVFKMDAESQSHAVLITGGFHTPNLKSLLKNKNISYVSLTPQVLQETNQRRYEQILLGQQSLLSSVPKASAGLMTNRTIANMDVWRMAPDAMKSKTVFGKLSGGLKSVSAARLASFTITGSLNLDESWHRGQAEEWQAPDFYVAGLAFPEDLEADIKRVLDTLMRSQLSSEDYYLAGDSQGPVAILKRIKITNKKEMTVFKKGHPHLKQVQSLEFKGPHAIRFTEIFPLAKKERVSEVVNNMTIFTQPDITILLVHNTPDEENLLELAEFRMDETEETPFDHEFHMEIRHFENHAEMDRQDAIEFLMDLQEITLEDVLQSLLEMDFKLTANSTRKIIDDSSGAIVSLRDLVLSEKISYIEKLPNIMQAAARAQFKKLHILDQFQLLPLPSAKARTKLNFQRMYIDKLKKARDGARLAKANPVDILQQYGLTESTAHNIADRILWLTVKMIQEANREKGPIKVGGHQAASASSLHLMMALELFARHQNDHIAHKPHAGPVYHAIQYLLGNLPQSALYRLRENPVVPAPVVEPSDLKGKISEPDLEQYKALMAELMDSLPDSAKHGLDEIGLHSYPGMVDPDGVTIPTGSVGLGPAAVIGLGLVQKWLKEHGYPVAEGRYFAVVGDGEFSEGNLLEMLPLAGQHHLNNVTLMIDFNRLSLDGLMPDKTLPWIQTQCEAAGWRVITLKWGNKLQSVFNRPDDLRGARVFFNLMESLSETEYQRLTTNSGERIRAHLVGLRPSLRKFLSIYSDPELYELFMDVGGHDLRLILRALKEAAAEKSKPVAIIAYTHKGYGLPSMIGDPANHPMQLNSIEVESLRAKLNVPAGGDFPAFDSTSPEGLWLSGVSGQFAREKKQQEIQDQERIQTDAVLAGAVPARIQTSALQGSELSTQAKFTHMIAQLSAQALADPDGLTTQEKEFREVARRYVTLSPDVASSTIRPGISHGEVTQHLRLGIAEMSAVSLASAFGKSGELLTTTLFPVVSIYDMFLFRRALDQIFYAQYWKSRMLIIGTPSGSTLSPEGAQHQSFLEILLARSIPNMIAWEPSYPDELEIIEADRIQRILSGKDQGRSVAYYRLSTLPILQKKLFENLSAQKKYQGLNQAQIMERWRQDVLRGGYRLVDYQGYEGYKPGVNVVNILSTGVMTQEALIASEHMRKHGIFANVIQVSSVNLVLDDLAHDNHGQLRRLIPPAERTFTPLITAADASPQSLAGASGIFGLGLGEVNLGITQNGRSTRDPRELYRHHGIDRLSITSAAVHQLHQRDYGIGNAQKFTRYFSSESPEGARLAETNNLNENEEAIQALLSLLNQKLNLKPLYKQWILGSKRPVDEKIALLKKLIEAKDSKNTPLFNGYQIALILASKRNDKDLQTLIETLTAKKDSKNTPLFNGSQIALILKSKRNDKDLQTLIETLTAKKDSKDTPLFNGYQIALILKSPLEREILIKKLNDLISFTDPQGLTVLTPFSMAWILYARRGESIPERFLKHAIHELVFDFQIENIFFIDDKGNAHGQKIIGREREESAQNVFELKELENHIESYLSGILRGDEEPVKDVVLGHLYSLANGNPNMSKTALIHEIAREADISGKKVELILSGLRDYLIESGYAPEGARLAENWWDPFENEGGADVSLDVAGVPEILKGYAFHRWEKRDRDTGLSEVFLDIREESTGKIICNNNIYIRVWPEKKLIRIHSFYPHFKMRELEQAEGQVYVEGKGMAVLKLLLSSYPEYEVFAAASPSFQEAFLRHLPEFKPDTQLQARLAFIRGRLEEGIDQSSLVAKEYIKLLDRFTFGTTAYGVVPSAARLTAKTRAEIILETIQRVQSETAASREPWFLILGIAGRSQNEAHRYDPTDSRAQEHLIGTLSYLLKEDGLFTMSKFLMDHELEEGTIILKRQERAAPPEWSPLNEGASIILKQSSAKPAKIQLGLSGLKVQLTIRETPDHDAYLTVVSWGGRKEHEFVAKFFKEEATGWSAQISVNRDHRLTVNGVPYTEEYAQEGFEGPILLIKKDRISGNYTLTQLMGGSGSVEVGYKGEVVPSAARLAGPAGRPAASVRYEFKSRRFLLPEFLQDIMVRRGQFFQNGGRERRKYNAEDPKLRPATPEDHFIEFSVSGDASSDKLILYQDPGQNQVWARLENSSGHVLVEQAIPEGTTNLFDFEAGLDFIDAIMGFPKGFSSLRARAIRAWMLKLEKEEQVSDLTGSTTLSLVSKLHPGEDSSSRDFSIQIPRRIHNGSMLIRVLAKQYRQENYYGLFYDKLNPDLFYVIEKRGDVFVDSATGRPLPKTGSPSLIPHLARVLRRASTHLAINPLPPTNGDVPLTSSGVNGASVNHVLGVSINSLAILIKVPQIVSRTNAGMRAHKKILDTDGPLTSYPSMIAAPELEEAEPVPSTLIYEVLKNSRDWLFLPSHKLRLPNFIGYSKNSDDYGYYKKLYGRVLGRDGKSWTAYRRLNEHDQNMIAIAQMGADDYYTIKGVNWLIGPHAGGPVQFKGRINLNLLAIKYADSGFISIPKGLQAHSAHFSELSYLEYRVPRILTDGKTIESGEEVHSPKRIRALLPEWLKEEEAILKAAGSAARLAAPSDIKTFALNVFSAQHRTGEIMVGETRLRFEEENGKLLVYGLEDVAVIEKYEFNSKYGRLGVQNKDADAIELLGLKTAFAEDSFKIGEVLLSAPLSKKVPVLLALSAKTFNLNDESIKTWFLEELKRAYKNENALFLIQDLPESLKAEIKALGFVFEDREEALQAHPEINELSLVEDLSDLPSRLRFFIKRMQRNEIYNLGAILKVASYAARTLKFNMTKADVMNTAAFGALVQAYEVLLKKRINREAFFEAIATNDKDADKLFLEELFIAPHAISYGLVMRAYQMVSKMTAQAA